MALKMKGLLKDKKKLIIGLVAVVVAVVFVMIMRKQKKASDALASVETQVALQVEKEQVQQREVTAKDALNRRLTNADVKNKVSMLQRLMQGVTNASEKAQIVQIIEGIVTYADYLAVYNAFGKFHGRDLPAALKYNLKNKQYKDVIDHINNLSAEGK